MKLLEFLPGIAQKTQARFKEAIYLLVRYASTIDISPNTYLIICSKDKTSGMYRITYDIREVFGYVAEYGKDCQVMRLRSDKEPIIELLY